VEAFRFEFKNAWAGLKASPVLALFAVIAMTLGVGATTFIYIGGNNYLTSLPVDEPDRYVHLGFIDRLAGGRQRDASVEEYLDFREQLNNVDSIGAFRIRDLTVGSRHSSRIVNGAEITDSVFEMLKVNPLLGRVIDSRDLKPGAERVVLLSFEIWRDFFNSNAELIGESIRIEQRPHTVVGVTKKNFKYPRNQLLWIPLQTRYPELSERNETPSVEVIVKLPEGRGISHFQQQAQVIVDGMRARFPDQYATFTAFIQPYTLEFIGNHIPRVISTLFLAGIMVLAIACANIANLFLALGNKRSLELAVQSALGAPRRRILLRFIIESMIVCVTGGIAGFILGLFLSHSVGQSIILNDPSVPFWIADKMSRGIEFSMSDAHNLLFVAIILFFSSLLAAAIPGFKMSKPDINSALKSTGVAVSGGADNKFVSALIVIEIIFSCALLIGASFLIHSSISLSNTDLGFDSENILVSRISLDSEKYVSGEQQIRVFDELAARFQQDPEISWSGFSSTRVGAAAPRYYYAEFGESYQRVEDHPIAKRVRIGAEFNDVLGVSMLQGRTFDTSDRMESQHVAIVSESLALKLSDEGSVIGKRIRIGVDEDRPWRTIIGVVPYIGFQGDLDRSESKDVIYEPLSQAPLRDVYILTKSDLESTDAAGNIARHISEQDPTITLYPQRTVQRWQEVSQFYFHLQAKIMICFAIIALLLSLIGIVGILFFNISQQKREIGIRKALGATTLRIILTIQKRLLIQLAFGLVIGVAIAFLLVKGIQSQLIGIDPSNIWLYIAVAVLLSFFIICVSLLPVRQAVEIHPSEALRDN